MESIFPREDGDLLFEAFNGGEEFEDHEEDEEKSGEDDGVDIVFNADNVSKNSRETGEGGDGGHATPDDEPDRVFENSLAVFAAKEIVRAFVDHEGGDEKDDELVEVHRVLY